MVSCVDDLPNYAILLLNGSSKRAECITCSVPWFCSAEDVLCLILVPLTCVIARAHTVKVMRLLGERVHPHKSRRVCFCSQSTSVVQKTLADCCISSTFVSGGFQRLCCHFFCQANEKASLPYRFQK